MVKFTLFGLHREYGNTCGVYFCEVAGEVEEYEPMGASCTAGIV